MQQTIMGSTIVVFGGSSGIGEATVRHAAAAGAKVVAVGRNRAALNAIARDLPGVETAVADLRDADAVTATLSMIDHIDHVCITAGTVTMTPILQADMTALRQPFEERVFGTMNVVRAALPKMTGGSFLFVTGDLVERPVAGLGAVTAAAAAVEALAATWVLEIPSIRFNIVSPGSVDTPLQDKLFGDQREAGLAGQADKLPGKRVGTADEIAHAILALIANEFINGAVLNVDGGGRVA